MLWEKYNTNYHNMTKILSTFILAMLLITGCRFLSQKQKRSEGTTENDIYEYFVAPVSSDNPRNSEADIIE